MVDRKEKIMVSDRQGSADNHAFRVKKIHRINKDIITGFSGIVEAGICFICWYEEQDKKKKGLQYDEKQEYPRTDSFSALVLHKNGQCSWYGQYGYPVDVQDRYFGIGSGSDFALGAVYAGATLQEAIRIASKLDRSTGFGIQVEGFDDNA